MGTVSLGEDLHFVEGEVGCHDDHHDDSVSGF